jgi:hypothetical protein
MPTLPQTYLVTTPHLGLRHHVFTDPEHSDLLACFERLRVTPEKVEMVLDQYVEFPSSELASIYHFLQKFARANTRGRH